MEFLACLQDCLITAGLPQEAVGSVRAGHIQEAVFPTLNPQDLVPRGHSVETCCTVQFMHCLRSASPLLTSGPPPFRGDLPEPVLGALVPRPLLKAGDSH